MRTAISIFILTLLLLQLSAQAANIRIQGIPISEQKKWLEKLNPRLVYVYSRPATSWRADDAAFFLNRLLIRSGYPDSTVTWQLNGTQTITLKVNRGPRFLFGRVSSNPLNIITHEQLDNYFFQPLIESEKVPRNQAPYLVDYPEKGAANIQNLLKSMGYWQAKVTIASINRQETTRRININLKIDPGKLHYLTYPTFTGISENAQKQLRNSLATLIGKPATSHNISVMNHIVHDYFRSHGFQFASISATDHHSDHLTRLHFDISPGNRFTVRDITIQGYQKTKPSRFSRYFDKIKGGYYDESHTDKITKQLLSTGAFQQVIIKPIKVNDSQLDLHVQVREAKARSFRGYAGIQSYEGYILGLAYSDHNFLGKLRRLNIRGEITKRKLLGETSITEPFFAGQPISFTLRTYSLQRDFKNYEKYQHGIQASFSWEPSENIATRLYGGLDYVSSKSSALTNRELGPNNYINSSLGFDLELDYRDNKVLPHQGFHSLASIQFGAIAGDASTSYSKIDLKASYRFPITEKSHLKIKAYTGAILAAEPNDLPIDLRYFSGGPDSVRSFRTRQLGPKAVSGKALGGEAYWNSSIEYIYAHNELLSTTLFYDTGQLYRKLGQYGLSNPSHALGLGLKLDLPIGPIRLEYGYNLNRHPGEPRGALHFSIGARF